MITYQYQIIRYRHDLTSGEHVNVGVIVFGRQNRFLKCEILSKYSRISNFYNGANGKLIMQTLRAIKRNVLKAEREFGEFLDVPESLQQITDNIIRYDDSSIFLSEVTRGVDWDLNNCLSELYRLYVARWHIEPDNSSESDAEAWKSKFKPIFDRYHVTDRLAPIDIETENDTFRFDKAWQNGSLHCYQTLSFNLKTAEGVKGKVYTWSGKLQEIKTANQDLVITFLSSKPYMVS